MAGEEDTTPAHYIGRRVFFWTGRGSHGYGVVRKVENGRAFIDPEPEAIKGSDSRGGRWAPRDYGVRIDQLNTEPRIWFEDN